ncbi:hypothetical protein C7M84_004980 [Penaeus vannamei]|uniref:Uncharacterized protein n=1 Tax=Penaeus vannamei TaxID=6689 RepID=A0A423TJ08_PENVA|nr:hypothetical protein C7M84_004980 [Penaeus vannamei]
MPYPRTPKQRTARARVRTQRPRRGAPAAPGNPAGAGSGAGRAGRTRESDVSPLLNSDRGPRVLPFPRHKYPVITHNPRISSIHYKTRASTMAFTFLADGGDATRYYVDATYWDSSRRPATNGRRAASNIHMHRIYCGPAAGRKPPPNRRPFAIRASASPPGERPTQPRTRGGGQQVLSPHVSSERRRQTTHYFPLTPSFPRSITSANPLLLSFPLPFPPFLLRPLPSSLSFPPFPFFLCSPPPFLLFPLPLFLLFPPSPFSFSPLPLFLVPPSLFLSPSPLLIRPPLPPPSLSYNLGPKDPLAPPSLILITSVPKTPASPGAPRAARSPPVPPPRGRAARVKDASRGPSSDMYNADRKPANMAAATCCSPRSDNYYDAHTASH